MVLRKSVKKIRKAPAVASLEAEFLKRVRARGGLSRVELARELNLVPTTAGAYVDRLIERGYLIESQRAHRSPGRPPTVLKPNPGGGRFIGIDFEAHHLRAVCVDFSQSFVNQLHIRFGPEDTVTERILKRIESAIEEMAGARFDDILAIGIAVPGWIDPKTNTAIEYNFFPDWRNVPIGALLEKRFKVPVFLENNIRAMALAELWFGLGLGRENFVCVGTRSGIGSGIVANGKMVHGRDNYAGEIGWWSCPVTESFPAARNDSRGNTWRWKSGERVEKVASLSAIERRMEAAIENRTKTSLAKLGRTPEISDFIEAVEAGDAFAGQVLDYVAGMHGWIAHQLSYVLNPEYIIFAGPLTELGERFLQPIQTAAMQLTDGRLHTKITLSKIGEFNSALGAAALALHEWKPKL